MAVARTSSVGSVVSVASASSMPVSRTASAGSNEGSPEYNAMRDCYDKMVDILKFSIDRLGDVLFAKHLIPLDVLEKTTHQPAEKTRHVLNYLVTRVKHDSEVFHGFLKILEEQSMTTVTETLLSRYEFHKATFQPSTLSQSNSTRMCEDRVRFSIMYGTIISIH